MKNLTIFPLVKIGLIANGVWPGYSNYFGFFIFIMLLSINLIFEYWHLITVYGNLVGVMGNLGVTVVITAVILKLIAFRIKGRKIRTVIYEILKDWDKNKRRADSNYEVMVKHMNRANFYSKVLTIAYNVLVSIYAINAMLAYFPGIIDNRVYVLPSKFPKFCKQSPTFEIICIYQFMCALISTNCHAMIEGFLALLVLHAGTKIHMLRGEIKKCSSICSGSDNKEISRNAMKRLIRKHMILIDFVEKIKDIYKFVSFFHVYIFTLLHVIVGYTFIDFLEKGDRSVKLFLYGIFTIRALLSTMIHCVAGEYLMNQSERIFDELYNSSWYEFHVKDIKAMTFMIMKTRKPVCLVAAKFSNLSVRFLMSVVKTSFSFLSLVRASR